MGLYHPWYLWGLLGILVPLALHLWSKKEGKTIKVGSISLLQETHSNKSNSIHLNQWVLLVMRMLMVALVVVLMAGPFWKADKKLYPVSYILEPSLLNDPGLQRFLDSLDPSASIKLLRPGLPDWNADEIPENELQYNDPPKYWQLVPQMETLPTDSIVVIARGYVSGLQGRRPSTEKPMHWAVYEDSELRSQLFGAEQRANEVILKTQKVNASQLCYTAEKLPGNASNLRTHASGDSLYVKKGKEWTAVPLSAPKSFSIALFATKEFENDVKYLKAGFKALATYLNRDIRFQEVSNPTEISKEASDIHIWLGMAPEGRDPKKKLIFEQDTLAKALILPGNAEDTYVLTDRLQLDNATNDRLPEQLLPLLDLDTHLEAALNLQDTRQVASATIQPEIEQGNTTKKQRITQDATLAVWIVLLLLALGERTLAYTRGQ